MMRDIETYRQLLRLALKKRAGGRRMSLGRLNQTKSFRGSSTDMKKVLSELVDERYRDFRQLPDSLL